MSGIPNPVFSVVIADDDELVVEALAGLIDDHPALQLVGAGLSGHDAARLCAVHLPHLVVLDVAMPLGGIDGIAAVQDASPDSVVVFYTAQADRRTCHRLIDAGASAVFAKGAAIDLAGDLHELVAAEIEQKHQRPPSSNAPATTLPPTAP